MKKKKKKKEPVVDKLEKRNRDLFLEMFKNQSEFPSAYSMIKSKRLDWSPTKIKKNFKSIRETGDFALDQRKVRSTVSKLNSESQAYLNDELSKDNSISLPTMKKLIFEKIGIDASSTTIR